MPESDPVFAAFCAAGLWPSLGKLADSLAEAGIHSPDQVTTQRLLQQARDGHAAAPVDVIGSARVAADVADVKAAVRAACASGGAVAADLDGESVLALHRYADAEERAATALARLLAAAKPVSEIDEDE